MMQNIQKTMGNASLAQNKRYSCCLGGAITSLSSIYKIIPIIHAGPGCGMQLFIGQNFGCGFQGFNYIGGSLLPGTNTHEQEIIFGGEQRLRETIQSAMEVIDGDLFVVLTGCTADIIGDDIKSILNEFEKAEHKVICVETAGFKGNSYLGYELAWEAIINQLVKPAKKNANTVNVFGAVPTQDVFWLGNLMVMQNLLNKLGLKVNTFYTNCQNITNVRDSSTASLNIFFSPYVGERMTNLYSDKFNIPSLRFPGFPIGPTATNEFICEVGHHLALDQQQISKMLDMENKTVYELFNRATLAFNGFNFQHHFAIIGDAATAITVTQFLTNDLGQIPVVAAITDNPPASSRSFILNEFKTLEYPDEVPVYFIEDLQEIHDVVSTYHPTYILGSSLDRNLANELNALFLSVTFPVTDKIILNKSYAGYDGCVRFIEDYFKEYFSML